MLTFADSDAQALYIHLRQALGGSHHIGRVYGFVCRDHDKFIHSVFDSHIGDIARTIYICMDRFARVLFHQGHMLVGGCMEHDLGTETLVDAFDTVKISSFLKPGISMSTS